VGSVHILPASRDAARQGAVETVIATIQLGIPVARMEILDEVQMDAVNRYCT